MLVECDIQPKTAGGLESVLVEFQSEEDEGESTYKEVYGAGSLDLPAPVLRPQRLTLRGGIRVPHRARRRMSRSKFKWC